MVAPAAEAASGDLDFAVQAGDLEVVEVATAAVQVDLAVAEGGAADTAVHRAVAWAAWAAVRGRRSWRSFASPPRPPLRSSPALAARASWVAGRGQADLEAEGVAVAVVGAEEVAETGPVAAAVAVDWEDWEAGLAPPRRYSTKGRAPSRCMPGGSVPCRE